MNCKQCGAELADDAKVCGKCGAQQETAQKNADGKCVSMRWKIFTCVKTAAILIAFVTSIFLGAKSSGFIGRPKGMSLIEWEMEKEYKDRERHNTRAREALENPEILREWERDHLDWVLSERETEPEVVEEKAKDNIQGNILLLYLIFSAALIMSMILLIPPFLIFRGKKSKALSVFNVISSIIAYIWLVMMICVSVA